ncbi:glycoside hydrolase family protein [Vallitalea okinawensis]|uniref:hypothetical protein n=1 Tax=Vallitalea okinawensis TaxID=2078660 RepID=UPI000CFABFCA|nr:hypothetical protein [Vallitalea okinawensis]
MNRYEMTCTEKTWGVNDGNKNLFLMQNKNNQIIGVKENNKPICFSRKKAIEVNDVLCMEFEAEGWLMTDRVKEIGEGFYQVRRSWCNQSQRDKNVNLFFDIVSSFEPAYYLIPGVSYNGNPWGNGNEPKGLTRDGQPLVFSFSRTGLPSATFSENNQYSLGIFATDEKRSMNSAGSLEKTADNKMMHRITWPEVEGPYTYCDRDQYTDALTNTLTLQSQEVYGVTVYISVGHVHEAYTGWTKAYDHALDIFKKDIKMPLSPQQIWELGISYAGDILYEDLGNDGLFRMGLLPEGKHYVKTEGAKKWDYRPHSKYEIGWCGQNGALSCALIKDYLLKGNKNSLEKGIKVLDTWQAHAVRENGLFYVDYNKSLDEVRKNNVADTCNLAWGAWQMMEAYNLAKEAGIDKPKWLDTAMKLCDFFLDNYNEEWFFGKSWDVTNGTPLDTGGTIGAFMIIALIKAYEMTNNPSYLKCATKAYRNYSERDLDQMVCTAGALDTCCVDKETCWPLLKTGIDLYEITKDEYYKNQSIKAGYYLLSWMYHYETVSEEKLDDEFNRYGYKTYGGTSVSAQHHHLDPWGALIALDWLRLAKLTGDERWRHRALATWQNAQHCLSNGTLEIHGLIRPKGSQNEAYFHTNWAFHTEGDNKHRINNWLVAWPTAFRLVTLMRLDDWEELE